MNCSVNSVKTFCNWEPKVIRSEIGLLVQVYPSLSKLSICNQTDVWVVMSQVCVLVKYLFTSTSWLSPWQLQTDWLVTFIILSLCFNRSMMYWFSMCSCVLNSVNVFSSRGRRFSRALWLRKSAVDSYNFEISRESEHKQKNKSWWSEMLYCTWSI